MTRCVITDLEVTGCAHCRGITETPPVVDLGPWFSAAYQGRCSACGDVFQVFDRIRADGDGGYLGECCAESVQ